MFDALENFLIFRGTWKSCRNGPRGPHCVQQRECSPAPWKKQCGRRPAGMQICRKDHGPSGEHSKLNMSQQYAPAAKQPKDSWAALGQQAGGRDPLLCSEMVRHIWNADSSSGLPSRRYRLIAMGAEKCYEGS